MTNQKEILEEQKERLRKSEQLFGVIKILYTLEEKDLAFQLRVIHDTYYRSPHWNRMAL